jgi:hypothetical protein
VKPEDFRELAADAQRRAQARRWILRYHRDLPAAQLRQTAWWESRKIGAQHLDPAADHMAGRAQVAHGGIGHRGLAAAGLADKRHCFAPRNGQCRLADDRRRGQP